MRPRLAAPLLALAASALSAAEARPRTPCQLGPRGRPRAERVLPARTLASPGPAELAAAALALQSD